MEENKNNAPEAPEEASNDLVLTNEERTVMEIVKPDDITRLEVLLGQVNDLQKKHGKSKVIVKGLAHKDAIKKINGSLSVWRNLRTDVEEERVTKVNPFNAAVRWYNTNYFNITELIAIHEAGLKLKKKALEDQKKADDAQAEKLKKEREYKRTDQLVKAGASFDTLKWSVGSEVFGIPYISLSTAEIETVTDGVFDNILAQMIERAAQISAAQEAANQQAEELERERKIKVQEELDEIARQKDELEKLKAELLALKGGSAPNVILTTTEMVVTDIIKPGEEMTEVRMDTTTVSTVEESLTPAIKENLQAGVKPTREWGGGSVIRVPYGQMGSTWAADESAYEAEDAVTWSTYLDTIRIVAGQRPQMKSTRYRKFTIRVSEKFNELVNLQP